jgi:hypothetical protein
MTEFPLRPPQAAALLEAAKKVASPSSPTGRLLLMRGMSYFRPYRIQAAGRPDMILIDEHDYSSLEKRCMRRLLRPYQVRALETVLQPGDPSMFLTSYGHLKAYLSEMHLPVIIPRKIP